LNSPHQNCLNSVSRYATKNYPKIKNLFYGQEQFIFNAFALVKKWGELEEIIKTRPQQE
jgi:uncharacterized pyridoxamine 5'-phosphate oxidase family protein